MKQQLIVAEKFYSIQGEGVTSGIPAVFLRLSACNLLCKSEHWICDSIASWQPKGTKTPYDEVLTGELLEQLQKGAHLVITGGEPLLQQKHIVKYITWFLVKHGFKPIIEIETNGTLLPNEHLIGYVDYWNCSPKLANSGETHKRRVNKIAIRELNKHNTIFKFVITEKTDFLNILQDYDIIDMKKLVLMPGGDTRFKLAKTRPIVAELCKEMGLRYSDRLQVVIWNESLGV